MRLERPERLEGSECFFHMGFFWVGRGRWLDTPVSPKSVGLLLCGNPGVEVRFFLLVACVREGRVGHARRRSFRVFNHADIYFVP